MRLVTKLFGFLAVVGALVAGPVAAEPAVAQSSGAPASDAQISASLSRLQSSVAMRSARAQAASRAALRAQSELAAVETRLDATRARIQALSARVARQALDAYMQPGGSALEIFRARDLAEASRRQTFLAQALDQDQSVVEQLRAARQDEAAEHAAALRARDLGRIRLREETRRLRELADSRKERDRLQSALEARIADYTAEADAISADEGNVEALLKARAAADRAAGGPDVLGVDGGTGGSRSSPSSGLIWPVHGPISSPFGPRMGGFHPGIDIAVGTGTPIHAARSGTVIYAAWLGGYGQCVIIDHGGGFSTLYAHQSQLGSVAGQYVSRGEVIGYVGSTGHSTGPHLHFETRVGSTPRNPMLYLR
ncbi:MAG: murein hydrolase activator EnvC family protein [Acidimicrobiales bacterium]